MNEHKSSVNLRNLERFCTATRILANRKILNCIDNILSQCRLAYGRSKAFVELK